MHSYFLCLNFFIKINKITSKKVVVFKKKISAEKEVVIYVLTLFN